MANKREVYSSRGRSYESSRRFDDFSDSEREDCLESDLDDGKEFKQAMLLLSKTFQPSGKAWAWHSHEPKFEP